MISVEEALNRIQNQHIELKTTILSISDSLGLVLAEDIYAPISLPSFRQSGMDGYVVNGFSKTFKLVGETQAGKSQKLVLNVGEAVRIFTGAAVSDNATAVIMQEKVTAYKTHIEVNDEITEGKNIRPIGEQLFAKTKVFGRGELINFGVIGLLASLGIQKIKVFELPKIALIVTGNELKSLNQQLNYGEIYESNSYALCAAAKNYGFEIGSVSKAEDYFEETKSLINSKLQESDILLITGGISVGDYDFVEKSLEELGVEKLFYKVNQKPGKPLYFGKKEGKFIFALPGNPAAALTCFLIYVIPLLNQFKGKNETHKKVQMPIATEFKNKGKRAIFLKAKIENGKVQVLEGQASSMVYAFAQTNALVYLDENTEFVNENDLVTAYLL